MKKSMLLLLGAMMIVSICGCQATVDEVSNPVTTESKTEVDEKSTDTPPAGDSAHDYSQLDKNTVNAQNQLEESEMVRFDNPNGTGIRVMFVGNSITLHGVSHSIGWHNEWGMAASTKEKDYVHILMQRIKEEDPEAAFCICQVSEWETKYKNGSSTYSLFDNARSFNTDIIIMRFIENCPYADFDGTVFKKELSGLFNYLDPENKAKVILTTGFWKHPGDESIKEYAAENDLPVVYLGDLGEDDEMKAIGLFEHKGVANHPGDLGMEKIAERIFTEIEKILHK